MTDGIIQKAFNSRIEALKRNPKLQWDSYNEYSSVVSLLSTIEQELIAEIKKVNAGKWPSHTPKLILEKELIGDNQE